MEERDSRKKREKEPTKLIILSVVLRVQVFFSFGLWILGAARDLAVHERILGPWAPFSRRNGMAHVLRSLKRNTRTRLHRSPPATFKYKSLQRRPVGGCWYMCGDKNLSQELTVLHPVRATREDEATCSLDWRVGVISLVHSVDVDLLTTPTWNCWRSLHLHVEGRGSF